MTRHRWSNRVIPPMIVAVVVMSVWYALADRPATPAVQANSTQGGPAVSPQPQAEAPQAVSDATVLPSISPTVHKQKGRLEFSVGTITAKHIQKVEFYVEQQFVGAAYSQPYSVAVNESALAAGNHTVVAKIYLDSGAQNSKPAAFMTNGTAQTPIQPTETPTVPAPQTTPTPAVSIAVPANLAVMAATDGTSATLNWDAVANATSYQVWRDGSQIATTTGAGYSDTGLNPGQTYDYSIVAVDADSSSDATALVAVTMPNPHVLGDSTTDPGLADTQSAQTPDSLPQN